MDVASRMAGNRPK